MRNTLISLVLPVAALSLLAVGCGSDGERGPPGESPDIQVEGFDEHADCAGGGVAVIIDGAEEVVVCDGEDGEGSEVSAEYHDDHAECPAGGTDVIVDGEVEAVVCDGVSPTIETERHDDHEDCPYGGVDVIVDGEPTAVLCDGEDGETPNITTETVAEHDSCPASATILSFGFESGSDTDVVICDGAKGEPGEIPDIQSERLDEHPECDGAGGTTITFAFDGAEDVDTVVCDGQDGEDGEAADVTVEDLDEAGVDHDCGLGGGYLVTVEPDGQAPATFEVCREYEPFDDCDTTAPQSPHQRDVDDPPSEFAGTFEIAGITDDDDEPLPEGFIADVGIGDVEADAPPVDPEAWVWHPAAVDGDFSDPERERVVAELGADELAPGEHYYLFRMSIDGGVFWQTCGLEGMVEIPEYDSDVDAGFMEVSATAFLHWDFDAEDEEDRLLDPPTGEGFARFSDGTFEKPIGSSTFFSDHHWAVGGAFVTSDQFPPGDEVFDDDDVHDDIDEFDDLEYFEFNSDLLADMDNVVVDATFFRSATAAKQVQVVAELDDGTLAMLPAPLVVESDSAEEDFTFELTPSELVRVFGGEVDGSASIERVRVYGFDAEGYGGNQNFRIVDIEFFGW